MATSSTARDEREKYERVWQLPGYRRHSPAEVVAPRLWERWGEPTGAQVNDFGCGTGRATAMLQGMGALVCGFDHAANALDPGVTVPFVQTNLWEMDGTHHRADYAICIDVMEHIPTCHVASVLENILDATKREAYFQIAHGPDIGVWGEPLHLTLKTRDEWAHMLAAAGWIITDTEPIGDYATGYHCTPAT